ncbi:MAG TPA: alkaline phosphatase family protein [Acidimicrobiia bacterium]
MPARVVVVGLDAADPDLMCELAREGRLPHTAELLRGGPGMRVTNPDGVYVGAVWPTLSTGTSPGRHGRCWPGRLQPGTYQIRPFHPSDLGSELLWVPLARAGRRVAVVDVPHTQADPELGVTQVGEWGAHDPAVGFHASPPDLADDLVARFGRHPVRDCDHYGIEARHEELVRDLRVGIERKAELTRHLLDHGDWDLFFAVFGESHCVGHQCWHVHDRDHPRHDPALAGAMGDPIVDVYERLDAALGHVLAGAGRDAEVFVVLSHGMGPHYDGTFLLVDLLRRLELAWHRQPSAWATGRDRLAHAWNRIARRAGLRPPRTWLLDGSRPFVRAPNAGLCGAIRLNVVGREPAGVVAPGQEYEELCSALEAEFLSVVNVETGEPAVRRVLRPAELFDGPEVARMPDLLVEWRQESPIRSLASPTVGRLDGEFPGHRTGDHRRDGLLLRRGPTMAACPEESVDARDLAPTIHALLDVPVAHPEGRPLTPVGDPGA